MLKRTVAVVRLEGVGDIRMWVIAVVLGAVAAEGNLE
jgi:FixJ family two-component response regulator